MTQADPERIDADAESGRSKVRRIEEPVVSGKTSEAARKASGMKNKTCQAFPPAEVGT
ncbi:hypothetical protein [Burkholderia ubonensis]|uniref:hypothetical protein n=1 Tax=Burkholderia ubonensis TaxID=101571 RepID=UPI0012FA7FDE|nr:hypothetical protein [Burkholderia ubonensis]